MFLGGGSSSLAPGGMRSPAPQEAQEQFCMDSSEGERGRKRGTCAQHEKEISWTRSSEITGAPWLAPWLALWEGTPKRQPSRTEGVRKGVQVAKINKKEAARWREKAEATNSGECWPSERPRNLISPRNQKEPNS